MDVPLVLILRLVELAAEICIAVAAFKIARSLGGR